LENGYIQREREQLRLAAAELVAHLDASLPLSKPISAQRFDADHGSPCHL
jgi:hypothetical protein